MSDFIITERKEYFERFDVDNSFVFKELEDFIFESSFVSEFGFDLETSGFSPFLEKIFSAQFSTESDCYLIDCETIDLRRLKMLLTEKPLIIQNATFDLPFLYKEGIIPSKVWDTYTSEYVLSMGIKPGAYPRGLEDLVLRYTGKTINKDLQKSIASTGINSNEAVAYALEDVRHLHKIKEEQIKTLNKRGLMKAAMLENDFTRALAYIEHSGIYLNQDAWYIRTRQLEYEEWSCYLELNKLLLEIDPNIYSKLKKVSPGDKINWASQKQVVELFNILNIPTIDKKTGKESIEYDVIKNIEHPLIEPYIKYKEYAKAVSTYGRNFFSYVLGDKRIHTKFSPIMDTGRTSSGMAKKGPFPNLQNLDSGEETRACFEAQGNSVLVICDYSSQEGVVLADRSQEPALLEFYRSGEADMHSYVARYIFPELKDLSSSEIKKLHPDKRTAAKAAGFAINYGGNGSTIASNMNISVKDGDMILEAYMKAFPKLKEYFEKVSAETMQNGYILINPVTGRKRYIQNFKEFYKSYHDSAFWDTYKSMKAIGKIDPEYLARVKKLMSIKSNMFRQSLNSPIQGTSADISKQAGIYLFNWIVNEGLFNRVKIVNFVHDEYVLECPENISDLVATKTKYYMERAGDDHLTTLKLVADPVISKKWKK